MSEETHVRRDLDRLFHEWAVTAAAAGAVMFLLLSPLDYISIPSLFAPFLRYRAGTALALLGIAFLARRTSNRRVLRLWVFLAVLVSAVTIEVMILDYGGHRSPYSAGMILLAVVALGLIPSGLGLHLLLAGTIQATYLVPILLWDTIDSPRIFITNNYFLAFVLAATVLIRRFNHTSLTRQIRLSRQLAENELRLGQLVDVRSEQLLQAATDWRVTFDSPGEMIMLVDEADLIVKANLATAHLTGRTLPQIIGTSIFALLPHESLPRELHPLVAMRRTGGRAQAEFRTVALGGWFLMTAEPSMEGGRRTGGAVITLRDITDVKLMERALTEARDTWEETFNTIQEGITIHDGAFRVLRANAAARRMLGRLDKPIEGHLCHEIFHGTDRPIGGCPGCESFRTGFRTTVNLEEPFLGRYLEITALPRPDGTIIHVFHDISERKQAMDELARAAQRVQGILERSPFGIFVVGEELLVEFANPAILSITGAGQEEFVGTFIAAFPAFRELSLTSRIQDALEEIPFRFGPAAFPCGRDGRVVIGHFTGLPLQERGQRKVLVFVEDVTDLKEAEEERLRLTELLLQARKMESIGTLASGIAHDFNNILLAVIGLSDAVAERIPAGHPAREDLGLVIGAAERGSNLVRQLLAFSRQQALKMQPLDLRQLVDETCRMLARMLPKNIAIEVRGEGALPAVVADAGQVEQVLMNLAINARDAMPEGGTLSVETTTLAVAVEDESHPGVSAGYWVVLVVRDSGIGMSAEVFPRIFDPFFTTKERGKGTGLGLASVYGIVSQHGGSVRAESAPGQGSTFFVYLPAAADAERGTLPPDLV